MRHNLLSGAITPSPRGMDEATAVARLVAPAGGALCAAARVVGTTSRTVDLAAVAAATDEHLSLAARAQKEARRVGGAVFDSDCIDALGRPAQTWTSSVLAGILPLHSCRARVWGAAPMRTSTSGSAPCLL